MDNAEYQMNELTRFRKQLEETEKGSLQYRKDGIEEYKKCLENDLHHFETLISILISGDYGAGASFAFARCSKRMNRRAWLFNTLAVIEFQTSGKFACQLWHKLDTDLQLAINRILGDAIAEYDADPISIEF